MGWNNKQPVESRSYKCGYCNLEVGNDKGYNYIEDSKKIAHIYICPNCDNPTFFDISNNQYPGSKQGNDILNISNEEVKKLYEEARNCFSVNAFTAVALCSRKLIMNISVHLGADENKKFIEYVNWLDKENYIPQNAKGWVDQIRKIGNYATHEIDILTKEDAKKTLIFIEFLLKLVYELPSMV